MHKIVRNDHEARQRVYFIYGDAMKQPEPPEKRELIDRYLAAYNAFDIDGMMALLAPTVRFENYSGEALTAEATGADEFRRLAERARDMFAEREQSITALEHADHCSVAHIAYRGRLCQDIPDGPAAGTVLELSGKSEFSFDGGLIAKIVDRS